MIALDGNSLTLETYQQIVCDRKPVRLDDKAREKMLRARAVVERAVQSGEKIYSINTGFGILSRVTIPAEQLDELQENFVRSHCCGVGEPHTEAESRGITLLRANVLAKGFSGVRPAVCDLLIEMLNRGVTPVIPNKGSVGASGDLAPLAHLAAVIIGEGEAWFEGQRMPGGQALQKAGLKPLKLAAKEGLSLVNGTQQMTAMGALYVKQAEEIAVLADLICTATLEGTLGTPRAFTNWVHQTRPFVGQVASARRMAAFMQDSEIYQSHIDCERVQDPYSIRCAPQVHGAALDLLSFARNTVTIEMNAATDNPLVNADTGEICSNGNFHGQPVAFALDILGMALAEIGSVSERRTTKLMNPVFSELPTFLVKQSEGLNSGFMMAQVTAAALVSENRLLSHPGSTDSMSTNNDKEDHVSMGPMCALKAKTILTNVHYILAIEALSACQALEFRKPHKPGRGPRFLYETIRKEIPALERDRYLHKDIDLVASWIRSGQLYSQVKEALLK
jgi:histidine ammonia-lyase